MALTPSQIAELKSQLKQQILHLSPNEKAEAERQIDSMPPESLEAMLKQQNQTQKIFRMIVEKQIPSVQIDENEKAIAVLSTKSISKGHVIIIPKLPVASEKELSKEIHSLSEQISKKLISSLKASSTSIIPEKSFGEVILNIIPIYDKPLNLQSPRSDASIEELETIKTEINVEKLQKKPKEKIKIKKKPPQILKLKRRIP